MSEEEDVISGVPQVTVLAAILFVIMISDIDENVKNSIVRSFVDDTRVNKMINHLRRRGMHESRPGVDWAAIFGYPERQKSIPTRLDRLIDINTI